MALMPYLWNICYKLKYDIIIRTEVQLGIIGKQKHNDVGQWSIDAENRSREAVLAVPRHIVLHMRPMKPVLI